MIRVSVVIPAHHTTDPYMAEALASVAAQTTPVCEIIVVRDVADRGPAWARNEAASRARGDWLLLLDADDTIDSEFVERAQRVITRSAVAPDVVVPSDTPLTSAILRDNYLPYCALVSRQLWVEMGGHQEPSPRGRGLCDWDFWIRCWLAESGTTLGPRRTRVGYIHGAMFQHRDRADSMSKWSMEHFQAMRADLWARYGVSTL